MARQEKSLAVCLEILQDYTAKDFSLFAVLTTADFYSHNSQFHFYRTIQTTWNSGTPHFHVSVVRHEEKCFFWSVSLQPTKRSTFPHAVLLRHERVACHCFMSFGLCDKNETASCGYKSQPLSARQTKKSPWLYSLEVFQGIPPRIFLAVP